MITLGLRLDPLDILFFRDGKPFEAGLRAASTEPMPQTLAGALRSYVLAKAGCDFTRLGSALQRGASFAEALSEQSLAALANLSCRGPWFALDAKPVLPMPATLHRRGKKSQDGEFIRLNPMASPPPGWRGALRPLWTKERERTARATGWLTLAGMEKFLAGGVPGGTDAVGRESLFDTDSRTGIVIGADTLTTEDSMIYAADYLALSRGAALYAELTGPRDILDSLFRPQPPVTLPLGGQGRRVRVTRCTTPVKWPGPPVRPPSKRACLVLTSPAPFRLGWRPERWSPAAAAVPGHVAFSGWDLARNGPKPTRFAVQAGSVFFFDTPVAPESPSLCDEPEDAAVGWGSFLQGVW